MSSGSGARRLLGQILKDQGAVHEGMVQEALMLQRERGGRIGELLVELGHVDEVAVARALAEQAGLPFENLEGVDPDPDALAKVDAGTARSFGVLPLRVESGELVVALADPVNVSVLADLAFSVASVRGVVSDRAQIEAALERHYGEAQLRAGAQLQEAVAELSEAGGKLDLEDPDAMASAAPVVKLLNYLIRQAVRDKASDIHFEPFEQDFKIRYRVDGVLYELEAPPPHLAVALISRVKVMADLDIAETRLPQDGRIELNVAGQPVDLRVSTLPTMFGESCVMRILDRSVVSLELERLGFFGSEIESIRELLELPHGIVLVTGPTGSGKTTTLYSMLTEANRESVKIITVEDPVEYDLEGIIQIPVQEDIGVTYARVLRSILRQDPDVILVGEIRDQDTARTAIEASLTGHLVFSTLHTNDAASAITRLLDIGVEPFLITATLQAVVAQRLVRRICASCREAYEPSRDVVAELGLNQETVAGKLFSRGRGCEECNHSGFRGRLALAEILEVDEGLRSAVLAGSSSGELAAIARESGMQSLRAAGLRAIYEGLTTVEEVLRETFHES